MTTSPAELAAVYLRHYATQADADSWAFDEVADRVTYGPDIEDAWRVTEAIVTAADQESLGYVGAGPLEDFVRRFGAQHVTTIETRARQDPKFRACLGHIWLNYGDLPDEILARVVSASGGRIKPLGEREA